MYFSARLHFSFSIFLPLILLLLIPHTYENLYMKCIKRVKMKVKKKRASER